MNVEIGGKEGDYFLYEDLKNQYTNIILKYTEVNGIRGKIRKVISLVNANNSIAGMGFFRQKM